ncbi:hypothetical protein FNV43_RR07291 [Rhamnella rubrinervis]|uniref:RNase H type-1 domain-containing protein n=1 Tax=Rhamnella rubrinervis TaxID=2594499 RepID=A0A8K0HGB6_9ROSA|nr:hypothetical protein FNV43_RR07291 [Rhamnella rubrinervis]
MMFRTCLPSSKTLSPPAAKEEVVGLDVGVGLSVCSSVSLENILWICDTLEVVREVNSSAEPSAWDSIYVVKDIKQRFSSSMWILDWNSRTSNRIADLITKFSLSSDICVSANEFSFDNLPCDIVNQLLCEQLGLVL